VNMSPIDRWTQALLTNIRIGLEWQTR